MTTLLIGRNVDDWLVRAVREQSGTARSAEAKQRDPEGRCAAISSWAPYLLSILGYRQFGRLTARLARFPLLNWVGWLARRLAYHVK